MQLMPVFLYYANEKCSKASSLNIASRQYYIIDNKRALKRVGGNYLTLATVSPKGFKLNDVDMLLV